MKINYVIMIALVISLCPNLCMALEKHYALVIGNSDYAATPLVNPVNDARSMDEVLRELGFDVQMVLNVKNSSDLHTVVKSFATRLGPEDVGLVYYSGHGMQLGGTNYLIPTRARINSEAEIEFEGYSLNRLLSELLSRQNALNVVILDACRDNPFSGSFRSVSKGLAYVSRNIPDCLIAYSTEPGGVASDGDGENGLFTEELINAIRTPEMDLTDIMMSVRERVKKRSNGAQLPWETSLLTKRFSFYKGIYGGDFPKPTIKLNNPWKARKWIGTGVSLLSAAAILYFGLQADKYYDQYLDAGNPASAANLHMKVENHRNYATYSSIFMPIPLSYMIYGWWKDAGIRNRERKLNSDK